MKTIILPFFLFTSLSTLAFGDEASKELLPGDEGYPTKQVKPLDIPEMKQQDGLFAGAGIGFGQGRSTEPDSSAGLAFLANAEVGYQMRRGYWNRWEAGMQFFTGQASFRTPDEAGGKTTLNMALGAMARFGYGYSLGTKGAGIMRVGVGPVLASVELTPDGEEAESDGTVSGIAGQLGWTALINMTDSLDLSGGFTWTHMQFDLNKIDVNGKSFDYDRNVQVNIPQVELGLRVRI